MTPYIISQCENHTIQERKCLPTFILAIIVNFNGFEETIADFQWFLRRPSPLNVFWWYDHCHQWFSNGFCFCYHRFQWFSMVPDHWSNDAMVSMDRHGLQRSFLCLSRVIGNPLCNYWKIKSTSTRFFSILPSLRS